MMNSRKIVARLLGRAGIEIGGNRPWDIIVKDEQFYGRVLRDGSLGAGESYMDGWWECDAIDELTAKVLSVDLFTRLSRPTRLLVAISAQRLLNRQAGARSRKVAQLHYDFRTDLFEAMLGRTMNYSCAYWRDATDLDAAQRNKMDLVCRKLQFSPGLRVLDLGCGFGALAHHAAQHYGCLVTGVTNSSAQHAYARKLCDGLPVQFLLADYRDLLRSRIGKFDRIVSIGMFEHVGRKNHRLFITLCHDLLIEHGLMLLHSIGRTVDTPIDLWVDRNIFPNSYLPTMTDIASLIYWEFADGRLAEFWRRLRQDAIGLACEF